MAQFMTGYTTQTYALLRIVAGFLFLWHGSQKLLGFPMPAMDGIPAFITYGAGGITPSGVYSMYDGAKGEVLGLDNLYKMTQSYTLALIDLANQSPD